MWLLFTIFICSFSLVILFCCSLLSNLCLLFLLLGLCLLNSFISFRKLCFFRYFYILILRNSKLYLGELDLIYLNFRIVYKLLNNFGLLYFQNLVYLLNFHKQIDKSRLLFYEKMPVPHLLVCLILGFYYLFFLLFFRISFLTRYQFYFYIDLAH